MRDANLENWAIDPGAVRAWQRGVVPAGAQRGVGDRATRGRAAYVPPNVVVAAADACCAQCAIPGAHALNASASATTNAVSVAKSPPRIVPGDELSDAGNSRKLVASLLPKKT